MKIICVGSNYQHHNNELEHDIDTLDIVDPIIFMKPDSSILHDDKNRFFIPDFSSDIYCRAGLVIRINKMGKNIAERFAHRYYNEMTIGLDMTAFDIQSKLKVSGLSWELSKSFDNSTILGTFVSKDKFQKEISMLNISLQKNMQTIQSMHTSQMIHTVDQIIAYTSRFFTLKTGDLIFTGAPSTDGDSVEIGDNLDGYLEDEKLLQVSIC